MQLIRSAVLSHVDVAQTEKSLNKTHAFQSSVMHKQLLIRHGGLKKTLTRKKIQSHE